MKLRHALFALTLTFSVLFSLVASAHKPSDSYLTLNVEGSSGELRWDVALRDLNDAIGIDRNSDGQITWGELRGERGRINEYLRRHLTVSANSRVCTLSDGDFRIAHHSDGAYAVTLFSVKCPIVPHPLELDYSLLFELDPLHRGIARLDYAGSTRTIIFSADARHARIESEHVSRRAELASAIRLGVDHILSGIDHLLFLCALLLPSVFRRKEGSWQPVDRFRPVFADTLRIVTAFTLAHSITLSLSVLGVVHLPSRWVESAIALSVAVAAANNLYPVLREARWAAAFALGLLHGFGFSAALMDVGLPKTNLALTLFGFNVGVELGQFAVVALFLPTAFLLRRSFAYRRVAFVGGSFAILALAGVWVVERAFVLRIIS